MGRDIAEHYNYTQNISGRTKTLVIVFVLAHEQAIIEN